MLLYVLVFVVTYPYLGLFSGFFNAIPAAVFGWLFGVKGGFGYLGLALPVNIGLFGIVNSANNDILTHVLGVGAFTLATVWIGWVRDLRVLNDRIRIQAVELQTERQLLHEEIARRMSVEEKLTHEALHDPLTELPNRRLFFDRLEHARAWCKRNPSSPSAVLYVDLDDFKEVNDNLGHQAGDDLLKQVAIRLVSLVRDIDTVGRIGGDEFAILLEAATSADDMRNVINRIQAGLALPYEVQGKDIVCEASIGAVLGIADYEELDAMLLDADKAMYQAKAAGGKQYRIYEPETSD